MSLIQAIPVDQAEGQAAELYKAEINSKGYVPNYVKAFSLHPEIYHAWGQLIGPARTAMRLRRYELVTFAAALALECTYCSIAHGDVLLKNFFSAAEIQAMVKDFRNAGLTDEEVALMTFAQKIIHRASSISREDMDALRRFGLTDQEIFDVVVVVTARSFFSKTLDALGMEPDDSFMQMGPELLQSLAVGRPLPKSMVAAQQE